jgi:hypothetical protein
MGRILRIRNTFSAKNAVNNGIFSKDKLDNRKSYSVRIIDFIAINDYTLGILVLKRSRHG